MKYINYFVLFAVIVLNSCKKEEGPTSMGDMNLDSQHLYDIMEEVYLWDTTLTKNPDFNKSPFDLLEDLRYKPLDKWSYISTTEEYYSYFDEGIYYGYGFGYSPDNEGNMRVTFVFNDSPLKNEGVERGWIIENVNGNDVNSQTDLYHMLGEKNTSNFTFKDPQDISHQFSATVQEIHINSVLYDSIFEINDRKIGYLVFQTFIEVSRDELLNSFKKFKDAAIDELIVDLRYNGGGRLDIGLLLGGLIGGEKVKDQTMVTFKHNENLADEDESVDFETNENSIDLDRVIFITSEGTASASEMLINGLDPFMTIVQVGDDTHGKPVGMYGFPFKDYTLVPICFSITNADGYGGYYDGLKSDAYVADDITHNFGDTAELCFNEALYYIKHDEFSSNVQFKTTKIQRKFPKGLRFEIGAL